MHNVAISQTKKPAALFETNKNGQYKLATGFRNVTENF